MAFFESLMTYSYNEVPAIKHGACILITLALLFAFFGGYWSAQLGWWWTIIFVFWIFWKNLSYLTYDNIGAKYKEEHAPARYIFALIPTVAFLLVYLVGHFAGPRGWWWLSLLLFFVYTGVFKVIQKARKG